MTKKLQSQSIDEQIESYKEWIGLIVEKNSGKPFKSTLKKATIKDIIMHPITHVPAFTFKEDESYVAAHLCQISPKLTNKM